MPRSFSEHRNRSARRGLVSLLLAFTFVFALPVSVQAQEMARGPNVTFQSMLTAAKGGVSYTLTQLRRFFTGSGVVTVREELRVVPMGGVLPAHELDFLGVEGEPAGSPLSNEWGSVYAEQSRLLVEHGGFWVHDLGLASLNYTLHNFGPSVCAGRSAWLMVVFPDELDKTIRVLKVCAETSVVLYSAEYVVAGGQIGLVSEVEALTFSLGAQVSTPTTSLVTSFPNFNAAAVHMGSPTGLVEPGQTEEYQLDRIQVRVDPLNNRESLILEYTDGIDVFFVEETPGASDPFGLVPVRQTGSLPHVIARFEDQTMSVFLFWDGGVSFQVCGRFWEQLGDVAKGVYTQATLGN